MRLSQIKKILNPNTDRKGWTKEKMQKLDPNTKVADLKPRYLNNHVSNVNGQQDNLNTKVVRLDKSATLCYL